jgi:hypothetical protein
MASVVWHLRYRSERSRIRRTPRQKTCTGAQPLSRNLAALRKFENAAGRRRLKAAPMTASVRADSRFFRHSFERRARWAVMAFLIVALVVLLSALSQRRETPWIHIGTVVGFEPGEWLYLDSMDRPFALRESTRYDDGPTAITPGVRVQVWGGSVGERRLVVARVRVLPDVPPR